LLKSKRYEPIELAEELGTLINVHMENLLDQVDGLKKDAGAEEPLTLTQVSPGQIGVIAVSPGPGLSRILGPLGAAAIVSGGQTMNPSTQDMLDAIDRLPTDHIIILPNNKNIILAARQAAELSAKHVRVIPTRTVPQGIAAMLHWLPDGDLESVSAAMERALDEVESGEVTTATRSVELDGVGVKEGQVIGLHNGQLKLAGDTLQAILLRLLGLMGADEREIITLYYGADVTAEQAEHMAEAARAAYPSPEVQVHHGGQPHYYYILSAE
jgi:dihydroxyacetone kinase-like predicted kinase